MKLKNLTIGKKMKIINDTWDEKLGLATVTIAGKFGESTGEAVCSIDDCYDGLQNRWVGYSIAHFRAVIGYLRAKKTALYQRFISARMGYYYLLDTEDTTKCPNENEDMFIGYSNAMSNFERYMVNSYRTYQKAKSQYENVRDGESNYISQLLSYRSDSVDSYNRLKENLEERENNEDN